ncbi:MAG: hypothetical protein H6727_17740 [Myxococcales bacterium]|nr:hypothetical protein [Myxococcales bacterium]
MPRNNITHKHLSPLLWLWLCLVPCFLAACGTISNDRFFEGQGSVSGVLTLPSGEPAANATIEVVNLPQLSTQADAQGRFILQQVPAGKRDIVFRYAEQFGLRLQIWIVRERTLSLENAQQRLLPSATIEGTVQATPRFGGKGIQVALKGLSLQTQSSDIRGNFLLKGVPPLLPGDAASCHSLLLRTASFQDTKFEGICPAPGEYIRLDGPLRMQPSRMCPEQTCSLSEVCESGYCVPDNGGSVKLITDTCQFPTVILAGSQQQERELLQNVGLGPLLIESVTLQDPEGTFRVESLGTFPRRLAPQEILQANLRFSAPQTKLPSFGRFQGTLWIQARHEGETKRFGITLSGIVAGQNAPLSECLQSKVSEPTSQPPQPGSPSGIYDVDLTNACDQDVVLSEISGTSPIQALLAVDQNQSWLIPLQKLPLRLKSGATGRVQFQWMPGYYGSFRGEVQLKLQKTETEDTHVVKIPLQTEIRSPYVVISHDPILLGSVAPGDIRQSYLPITLSEPQKSLSTVQVDFLTAFGVHASQFRALSVTPRLEQQSHQHILGLRYLAPAMQGRDEAWLLLRGLPFLGGYPYAIKVQATVTQSPLPRFSPLVDVGSMRACTSPDVPLVLSNPTETPMTINLIDMPQSSTSDFLLRTETLPLTLQPNEQREVAWVRFTPPALGNVQPFRSFASLRVEGVADKQTFSLRAGAQAASGIPRRQLHPLQKIPDANIVVYLDPSIESFAYHLDLKQRLLELFDIVKREGITLRFFQASLQDAALPIMDLEQLWTMNRDVEGKGLMAINKTVEILHRNDIQNQGVARPTIVLAISTKDDVSPFSVQRYLFQSEEDLPWLFFSAVPQKNCSNFQPNARYLQSTQSGSGLGLDLCDYTTSRGNLGLLGWLAQLKATLFGQRTLFSFSQTPDPSSIVVKHGETQLLPNIQWSYDATGQLLKLSNPLPQHQEYRSLEVLYHTPCATP